MIYLELFWSFFQVGLFSIGGGYAAMSLIQDKVVDIHPWLTMTGFADIMAIAEMTPGPIAVNAATFVGIQVAGLRPAVIAMIASAGISLLCMALYGQRMFPADLGSMDLTALAIFLVDFVILRKWKPSPIKVMASAAVAGIALYGIAI